MIGEKIKEILKNEQTEINIQTWIFLSLPTLCKLAWIKYDHVNKSYKYSTKLLERDYLKLKKTNFLVNFKFLTKINKCKNVKNVE